MSGLSEQRLAELRAVAENAENRPLMLSDCEGVLKVWALSALEHITRDENGEITGWSEPGSYRAADLVAEVELDMGSWDPGEDVDDDQRRQDIGELVTARAAVPALLAEVERLAGMVVTAYERVAELEQQLADAQVQAAAFEPLHLGDPTALVSHRCVNPTHPTWLTAGRADRRGCPWCRLAEVERIQQPVGQTVFLADYDGAEEGPKLFATLDAAQAWVADWSSGDGPWDWFERDGIWEQWGTDPDSDRPAGRGAGTVTPLTLPGGGS